MDSFFGIGLFELIMIAVVALLVLGPERLPGAMREVAKWIRQLRNLSSDFQSQFSEEFKMLDEINPRRIINEALDPNAQPKPAPAAKPPLVQGGAMSAAAPKPVTPPAPKPLAAKPPAPPTTAQVNAAFPAAGAAAATAAAAAASREAEAAAGTHSDAEPQNTILPPGPAAADAPAAIADAADAAAPAPAVTAPAGDQTPEATQ